MSRRAKLLRGLHDFIRLLKETDRRHRLGLGRI